MQHSQSNEQTEVAETDMIGSGEAAEIIGCHPVTLQKYAKAGAIPGARQPFGGRGWWKYPRDVIEQIAQKGLSSLRATPAGV